MIEGSIAGTLVRLVLSLSVVLTLMVFLARYLTHRQTGGGMSLRAAPRRRKPLPLEVVTRQGLSRGSSVAVVRVGGQLLLLGVTESAVSVLRELEPEPEPDAEAQPSQPNPVDGQQPVDGQGSVERPDLAASVVESVRQRVESLRQWTVRRG